MGVNARNNLFDRLGRWPRNVCVHSCVWGVWLVGWGLMAEESGETQGRHAVSLSNVHKQKLYFRWMLCQIRVIHIRQSLTLLFIKFFLRYLLYYWDVITFCMLWKASSSAWHFSAVRLHYYLYHLEDITDGQGGVYFKCPTIYCLFCIPFTLTFTQHYQDLCLLIYH